MAFTVTGIGARGLALIGCETVLRALEKAAELMRRGFLDVMIADLRGAQYTPDQFDRFFRSER